MGGDGDKGGGSVEEALKLKYQLLRQKKLAKQKDQSGDAGGVGGAPGASISSASSSGLVAKAVVGAEKVRKREEPEAETVSVAALDRSVIAAVQATTSAKKVAAPSHGLGATSQPIAKRMKLSALPMIPKRAPTERKEANPDGEDGEAAHRPDDAGVDGGEREEKPRQREERRGSFNLEGFSPAVHEAMERAFLETGLPRDSVERKVMSALQEMPEQDALRALDQYLNSDMSRIRNKGAYLWGIVRNIQTGSRAERKSFGGDRSRDTFNNPFAPSADGTLKMLWPEEEQVIQELDAIEGRLIEKEFRFDNHGCSLPPAESLFSDETYMQPELAQVLTNLNSTRARIGELSAYEWDKHTSSTSLGGRVLQVVKQNCRPELLSSAWLKAYELIVAYPLVPPSVEPDGILRSLHLCETGAMVCALNHFLKNNFPNMHLEWTGHHWTPSASKDGGESKPAGAVELFMKDTHDHWVPGVDGSTDLRQRGAVEAVWQVAKDKGTFMLVTADGHGEGESAEAADSEGKIAPHMLSQVVTALGVLGQGGSLVLRAGTLCEHTSIGIMYLLNSTFTEVTVARPCTAASCMCEVYVVCVGFKGIAPTHLDKLLQAVGTGPLIKDGKAMSMVPESFLSPGWLGQMKSCSELFARLQSCAIEREMRLLNRQTVRSDERKEIYHMRDAVAMHWQGRFRCKQLSSVDDRITREGLSSATMSAAQASSGGRIWHSIRGRYSLQGSAEGGGGGGMAKQHARQDGSVLRLEHAS